MRKFISNNKLLVTVIVIALCFWGCIMLINSGIDGKIRDYVKYDTDFDYSGIMTAEEFYEQFKYNYGMEQEVVEELYKYPERYSEYFIRVNVKNYGICTIFDVKTSLSTQIDNMWVEPVFGDCIVDLKTGEEWEAGVSIIIRTEGMTDDEIDKLIKSVGITISANVLADFSPIVASKTIYFNK